MPGSLRGRARLIAPTAQLGWAEVAKVVFADEPNQTPSANTLTVTNRVTGQPLALNAINGATITGGVLSLVSAANANLAVTTASTRTSPLARAALLSWWPEWSGEPVRFAATVASAPSFTESSEAWGVMLENSGGLGSGNTGYGYSSEVRLITNVQRFSRWASAGSTNAFALASSSTYSAQMCGMELGAIGPHAFFSLTNADADDLSTINRTGPIGSYGSQVSGTGLSVQENPFLGVFGCAGATIGPNVPITTLRLWAYKV